MRKTKKTADTLAITQREQENAVYIADIFRKCGQDIAQLEKLSNARKFSTDVKLQNKALALLRGVAIKMEISEVIDLHKSQDIQTFLKTMYIRVICRHRESRTHLTH